MKKFNIIIGIIAFAFVMASCSEKKKDVRIPRSVGGTSEILLITQNDEQWNTQIGRTVCDFFEQEQYGLPQPEKTFKVAHININAFSDMFKKHRNLIIANINTDLKNAIVETQENWKASPQYVMRITAPSTESWVNAFNSQKEELKNFFDKNERARFSDFFRPNLDTKILTQIKNSFGISMLVPEGYYVAIDKDNFMWLFREMSDKDMIMNFIIYELPYRDTSDFNPHNIIQVRDSIVKKYILGHADHSYMKTHTDIVVPHFKTIPDFPAGYAIETRGMWEFVGDRMGGPFLSYTIVSPERTKLITAEGFLFYPNKEKRDYLRQMETILYSLKFVN